MSAEKVKKRSRGVRNDDAYEQFNVYLGREDAERMRNTVHALSTPPISPTGAKLTLLQAWRTAMREWVLSMEEMHNKGKPFPAREA